MMESNLRQRKTDAHVYTERESTDEDKKRETVAAQGWCAFAAAFALAVVLLFVVFLAIIPSPIQPESFSLPTPPDLEGPLAANEHLTKVERVYEGKIVGPESVVVDGDHLYTGTADGKILDIHRGEARILARLGKEPCGEFDNEPTCGRPLGMRLDKDGYLIVADAYLGLFKINVATGDVHELYSSTVPINGKVPKFLNDLDIGGDGTIYISDSSTRWDRRHNRYCIVEAERSGRILAFNPETNTIQQLFEGLAFANGVQLSSSGDHLLVAETSKARIMRYYLHGDKKGQLDVFIYNLPGLPDNIRRTSRGTYWIGFAFVRHSSRFSFIDFASQRPWMRSLIAKVISQESLIKFAPKYGLLIEVSKDGQIIRSLHDSTGKRVWGISEVEEKDGVLYLGSYIQPFLGRLYSRNIE